MLCVGVKFRNRIVNEGFTGSRTPHRNNRPSPRRRGRGKC